MLTTPKGRLTEQALGRGPPAAQVHSLSGPFLKVLAPQQVHILTPQATLSPSVCVVGPKAPHLVRLLATPWTMQSMKSSRILEWVTTPFSRDRSNRGLLHCRRILSQLSYQGRSLQDFVRAEGGGEGVISAQPVSRGQETFPQSPVGIASV